MSRSTLLLLPVWTVTAVCMSAPFLVTAHSYPIPTFYGEFVAAICWAVFAVLVLVSTWDRKKGLPVIALCPFLLSAVLLAQLTIAPPLNPFFSFAACIALLGAAVACGLGAQCRTVPYILEAVAAGVALGALVTVGVEFAQLFRIHGPEWLIGLPPVGQGRRMWGNLYQPNHVASYLAIGIAACLFLRRGAGRLAVRIMWSIMILTILFGMALTVSRMAWLHVVCIGLFAGSPRALESAGRRRWFDAVAPVVLLAIAYDLCNVLMDYGNALWQWDLPTSLGERMQQGASLRLFLWKHAFHMFISHPWLGAGWGDYAWNQYIQTDVLGHVEMSMNAHNIVLDLLAKVGLLGLLAVTLPCVGLVSLMWTSRMTASAAFLWSLIGVLTIHSMLEYPLHYLYFLLPFAFAVGYLDTRMLRFPSRTMTWVLSGVLVVCSGFLAARMWVDYKSVERLYYAPAGLSKELSSYQASTQMLLIPYATLAIAINSVITQDVAPVMAPLERQATQFYPGPATSQRYALSLALQGKTGEAVTQVRRLHNQYWMDYGAQSSVLTQACLQKSEDLKTFCQRLKSENLLVGVD